MKTLVLLFIVLSFQTHGQSPCGDSLESFPVRHRGRVKPLLVHARESLHYITGQKDLAPHSATQAYCLLSLESLGFPSNLDPTVTFAHPKLREFLGLSKGGVLTARELLDEVPSLRMELAALSEENSYKKALERTLGKAMGFKTIIEGNGLTLPVVEEGEVHWVPLSSLKEGIERPTIQALSSLFIQAKTNYDHFERESPYLLELSMVKMRLPLVSMLFTLVGLALLVLLKSPLLALVLTALSLLSQGTLVVLRVLISGRAPITNMYETVLFSGLGALVLALGIGIFKREKAFLFAGLSYNAMTLMMMSFATGMLSDSINPLVPVLRDNFWLSTHVTTVIFSYGAFALSWVLANTVLIKKRFGHMDRQDEASYSELIYTCLKYGTTLLAAGVILGGIWADYSWGRFWGWDPKETWSLIVLCLYLAILHGRYTNWIRPPRFIPLVALAFLSVLMAWFGVNYILASGLHSYGFSEGGAIFLGSCFGIQFLILGLTLGGHKNGARNWT